GCPARSGQSGAGAHGLAVAPRPGQGTDHGADLSRHPRSEAGQQGSRVDPCPLPADPVPPRFRRGDPLPLLQGRGRDRRVRPGVSESAYGLGQFLPALQRRAGGSRGHDLRRRPPAPVGRQRPHRAARRPDRGRRPERQGRLRRHRLAVPHLGTPALGGLPGRTAAVRQAEGPLPGGQAAVRPRRRPGRCAGGAASARRRHLSRRHLRAGRLQPRPAGGRRLPRGRLRPRPRRHRRRRSAGRGLRPAPAARAGLLLADGVPPGGAGRRHRPGPRRLLAPARPGRARLLLPQRRPPRHAHGPRRRNRRAGGQQPQRGGAGRPHLALRRGAQEPPDRPRPGRPPRRAALRADPGAGGDGARRGARGQGRHRPGDAHLPGPAHLRERRVGRAGARPRRRRALPGAARASGRGQLPFPGRPHRQGLPAPPLQRRAARLAPPARQRRAAGAQLRADSPPGDQARRARSGREPARPLGPAARRRAHGRTRLAGRHDPALVHPALARRLRGRRRPGLPDQVRGAGPGGPPGADPDPHPEGPRGAACAARRVELPEPAAAHRPAGPAPPGDDSAEGAADRPDRQPATAPGAHGRA
ncbi:rsmH, partial [Symbiodinium pilosum]